MLRQESPEGLYACPMLLAPHLGGILECARAVEPSLVQLFVGGMHVLGFALRALHLSRGQESHQSMNSKVSKIATKTANFKTGNCKAILCGGRESLFANVEVDT